MSISLSFYKIISKLRPPTFTCMFDSEWYENQHRAPTNSPYKTSSPTITTEKGSLEPLQHISPTVSIAFPPSLDGYNAHGSAEFKDNSDIQSPIVSPGKDTSNFSQPLAISRPDVCICEVFLDPYFISTNYNIMKEIPYMTIEVLQS